MLQRLDPRTQVAIKVQITLGLSDTSIRSIERDRHLAQTVF